MGEDELLEELLAKPTGPAIAKRERVVEDFTREISVSGSTADLEVRAPEGEVNEGTALKYLEEEGLTPDEWEVTGFRKIKYGAGMESVRFTYKRVATGNVALFDQAAAIEEAISEIMVDRAPVEVRPDGDHGFLVLIGDMQFGKMDGDGPAGTLRRTIECIDQAAGWLAQYRLIFDIGHIHVAWLGDHVEGFVSQGGANVWRTVLTLNEQIRLTQAVMLHALVTFAPLAEKVTMVAVPGNHGEPVRFEGNGITRYDDSHDTEQLIGIHNAIAKLEVPGYEHVNFYVPHTDELTVYTEVAGTRILHTHGHKFGSKKEAHIDWWKGQEFGRESLPAHLLVAGHLHNEYITENFIQVPAMESESTWWRHLKGQVSKPGLVVAITKDGHTPVKHTIYGTVREEVTV